MALTFRDKVETVMLSGALMLLLMCAIGVTAFAVMRLVINWPLVIGLVLIVCGVFAAMCRGIA